jgi:hypothetical protein
MPLSDMYRAMLESTNPATWEANRQKQQMGEYELESKRRAMADEQSLRELYSSGRNVSPQDVMAISPELGIKLQQAGNQSYLQQLQAQDLVTKQNESQSKLYAQHISPIAQDYFDDIKKGMPEQQAEYKFRTAVGQAQADIEQRFGMRPQADFTKFTPMQIAQRAHSLGVDIPHLKEIEQQQQNQLAIQQKQTPGAGELQQEYVLAPDGVTWMPKPNPYKQPRQGMSAGAGPSPYPEQAPYQFTAPSGQKILAYDLGSAAQAAQQLPDGPDKEAASKWIDEQWSGMRNPQKPKTKQQLEVETAGAKKKAELEAEEQAMSRKATNAYDMLPSPDRIRNLIKGSISGDVEYWANRAGGLVGKSLEAGDLTGALKVIEGQMADTVAMFPGAQSDKELEARMKTIGNPSGEISADTRLKAFDEWQERMQKYAAQHADYDDTKLVDMVKDKKLTADQALQIRKRRMSGGL